MSGMKKRKVAGIKNNFVFNQQKKENFLAKHKTKLFRRLFAFSAIALLVTVLLASTLVSQSARLEEKAAEQEKAAAELAELKKEEKQHEEELKRLKDDEYIAELARKNYFLSDEGEIIFNIPDPEENNGNNGK